MTNTTSANPEVEVDGPALPDPADLPSALYVCAGKSDKGIIGKVRTYVEKKFHKVFSEWHRSGGGSGDLSEEIAQLDSYRLFNGAQFQLYTVLDHNTNGYAEFVSVLLPHKHTDEVRELVKHLVELDFVTSHKNLRERPYGYKCHDAYLNEYYRESGKKPFSRD
ncbi:MAG: hypothetical protein JWN89_117 [Parcubacteria group bacterium]|nr:hypothetical protein [Parcubacteria group bacterium]